MKHLFLTAPRALALLLLGMILAAKGHAQQPTEFLSLNYYYLPQSDFKDMDGKATVNNFEASLLTPAIKLGKRTTLINGFYYRLSDYHFEELSTDWNGLPTQLHDIRYSLIIRQQLSRRWTLVVTPRVNARGNFKESLSGDDLFPGATVMALHSTQGRLRWGIGATYNNDFNHNTFMPVAGLYYATERMRLNITLPNNGQLIFTPSKKLEYGLSFNIEPGIYHLGDMTINKNAVRYLRTLNALVSPTLSYNLAGSCWLNARAGYVLIRNYDLWDENYEARQKNMENNFDPAPFASVGLSIRLNNRPVK